MFIDSTCSPFHQLDAASRTGYMLLFRHQALLRELRLDGLAQRERCRTLLCLVSLFFQPIPVHFPSRLFFASIFLANHHQYEATNVQQAQAPLPPLFVTVHCPLAENYAYLAATKAITFDSFTTPLIHFPVA